MEADRDILRRIAGDEAWLRNYPTPTPTAAVVKQLKQVARLEADLSGLMPVADPEPSPELLARIKHRARAELPRRTARATGSWWRDLGLAAAACLAITLGLLWQSPLAPRGLALAGADPDLDRFVETLEGVVQWGDAQLASIGDEVSDLEWRVYEDLRARADTADSEQAGENDA